MLKTTKVICLFSVWTFGHFFICNFTTFMSFQTTILIIKIVFKICLKSVSNSGMILFIIRELCIFIFLELNEHESLFVSLCVFEIKEVFCFIVRFSHIIGLVLFDIKEFFIGDGLFDICDSVDIQLENVLAIFFESVWEYGRGKYFSKEIVCLFRHGNVLIFQQLELGDERILDRVLLDRAGPLLHFFAHLDILNLKK